jgi:catechol 2,3-dioxygenase-like lactoylglutathione lyase family enzyme
MGISRLHHVNIRTTDLDATRKFYEDVVGLEAGPRPPFGNPGVWLYAEGHPWVHVSIADAANQGEEGADEGFGHIAFDLSDMNGLVKNLDGHGIDYDLHASPDRRLAQLFFYDPNGVQLEFTCALADAESDGLAVPDRSR